MRIEHLAVTDDLLVGLAALSVGVNHPVVRKQILGKEHDRAGGNFVPQQPPAYEMLLERLADHPNGRIVRVAAKRSDRIGQSAVDERREWHVRPQRDGEFYRQMLLDLVGSREA